MNVIDGIKIAFENLRNLRFFVSEADFQHSLAIELQKTFKDTAQIILEFPIKLPDKKHIIHIDIMIIKDGKYYPIELKYKTRKIQSNQFYNNTQIQISELLTNHSGNDDNCYHIWADVARIEWLVNTNQVEYGVCIFITNQQSFWCGKSNPDSMAYAFRTSSGLKSAGWHRWKHIKTNTSSKHILDKPDLFIHNDYNFQWDDFYDTGDKYGLFKSLFIEISPKNKKD